jgi:uncharacterized protein
MSLRVEVAYASPQRQVLRALTLPDGSTVADALRESGLAREFPEIDLAASRVGIYGREVTLAAPLRDRDRVEILRPLTADPGEFRRRRARAKRPAR